MKLTRESVKMLNLLRVGWLLSLAMWNFYGWSFKSGCWLDSRYYYVAMYGYSNSGRGFAVRDIRRIVYDCTHMCQVCSNMEVQNQVRILNKV